MNFQDEFEYVAQDDNTYDVEVSGCKYLENGQIVIQIDHVTAYDSYGNTVDDDTDVYSEIKVEAQNRDYDADIMQNDYAYCDADINNFLKEVI